MADRTVITPISVPLPYTYGGAALTWVQADVVNKNRFVATGRELVLARNQDGSNPHNVTISGSADPYGRTTNVTRQIVADAFAVFQIFPLLGYQQTDGYIYLEADNNNIYFAVLRLP